MLNKIRNLYLRFIWWRFETSHGYPHPGYFFDKILRIGTYFLTKKEKQILFSYYLRNKSILEISEIHKCTREYIKLVLNIIKMKVKRKYNER